MYLNVVDNIEPENMLKYTDEKYTGNHGNIL